MKRLRSLDQISTFSCDYALDLALLINVTCDSATLSLANYFFQLDRNYSEKRIRIEMKSISIDA
jgi:hypothetical protein